MGLGEMGQNQRHSVGYRRLPGADCSFAALTSRETPNAPLSIQFVRYHSHFAASF